MKIKKLSDGKVRFMCPGCGENHVIGITTPNGPNWTWNGSEDAPTFKPSVLVTSGHYSNRHHAGDECWCDYNRDHPDDVSFKCVICHSFVTDGKIQFLGDCSHELANQTVELPDIDIEE